MRNCELNSGSVAQNLLEDISAEYERFDMFNPSNQSPLSSNPLGDLFEDMNDLLVEVQEGSDPARTRHLITSIRTTSRAMKAAMKTSRLDAWASTEALDAALYDLKRAIRIGLEEGGDPEHYTKESWAEVLKAARTLIDTTLCALEAESHRAPQSR